MIVSLFVNFQIGQLNSSQTSVAVHYCTPKCPKHIAIPEYFALFNDYKRAGEVYLPIHWNIYHSLIYKNGMAADCIGCGQCERRCPQHLPIISLLKEFSTALDGRTGHDY